MRGLGPVGSALGIFALYEVIAYAVNFSTLKGGGTTTLPLDLIGALIGYPGVQVQPVQVTAQYASQQPEGYAPQDTATGATPSLWDEITGYLSDTDDSGGAGGNY
jgi:hypothetical protein